MEESLKHGFIAILALLVGSQLGCGNSNNPSSPSTPVVHNYPYAYSFGVTGTGNGQFNNPWGVLIYNNSLFVADFSNHRVEKFDGNGNFRAQYTLNAIGGPTGIAVDKNGVIYVTDWSNSDIQTMDLNGNYIATLGSGGSGLGQFSSPAGIATDGSGRIYVTENANNRIQRCDPSNMPSSCVTVGGTASGTGNGQFDRPYGIHLDGGGNVWVADFSNNRVQELNSSLAFQTSIGTLGSGNGQFNEPNDVIVDQDGNIIVSEWGNTRIQKLTASGSFLQMIGTGKFLIPMYMTLDPSGRLFVSDYDNNDVVVFNPN